MAIYVNTSWEATNIAVGGDDEDFYLLNANDKYIDFQLSIKQREIDMHIVGNVSKQQRFLHSKLLNNYFGRFIDQ